MFENDKIQFLTFNDKIGGGENTNNNDFLWEWNNNWEMKQ